jgi:hypothetical protein
MVKTMVSGQDFPLNQSIEPSAVDFSNGRGEAPALAPSRTAGGCNSPLAEASTGVNMSSTGSRENHFLPSGDLT